MPPESFNATLGRWTVWVDGRRMYRARWVMEQRLGRPLETNEHVHHRNGDKADDRIENLELLGAGDHHRRHTPDMQRVHRGRMGYEWSFRHPHCVECGTTERRHVGHGKCERCYFRQKMRERMAAESPEAKAARQERENADRRQRYATDPEYRAKAIAKARANRG